MHNEVWLFGGEEAKQLSMIPIQYIDVMADIVRRRLREGGYWPEMYKGRIVSRVTEGDISKVGAIAITYLVNESNLLWENAVTTPLQ